ncbi:thiol-disulfide oxidoreductase DCC family protein [Aestuariibacter sp. A3R04]|uniref:thiol-disulfide oxidoreductase DCC family protein n=1 Tax=Aestuariibacter sp. A3R04 TaxID=2841571 RepID=UPI001C09709A|nr:DUF393 domain-containing protein [Aestuariibacter sp. A3R04]MBU3021978.1 DUF393 domain-containing protein [Aestuariibacter sp. A3R04]
MKIFYDSTCPLCCAEMRHLKNRDGDNVIQLVDINGADFPRQYPQLDWHALNARIHVMLENGRLVSGLDATHAAWKTVGRGWFYAPLRWPLIRILADRAYELFAKHRYTISFLLTGKRRDCSSGQCVTTMKSGGKRTDERS